MLKIICAKICCMLFLIAPVVASRFNHEFQQRSRLLQQYKNRGIPDAQDNEDEHYMELRAIVNKDETGSRITLQNRAAMNTRLRVLYIDQNGNPGIAETGRLLGGQTKSVQLPANATNVKIIVEKDMFAENWRVVYEGFLTSESQCIRIVGVTFLSNIHPCA